MVTNHFIDNEAQKFFRKFRVEIGVAGKLAQAGYLFFLARTIGRWQAVSGLIFADRLRDFEPLGQHEHQRRIDIIDAFTILLQFFVHDLMPDFCPPKILSHLSRTQSHDALFHLPYP